MTEEKAEYNTNCNLVAGYHVSEKASRYLVKKDRAIAFKRMYVDVMGDAVGALWLSQLAYWTPRATRTDGYIYKSYKEWERETGLSKFQIKRCTDKAKEMGIISVKLKKANGAPTLHYKINHSNLNNVINSIIDKLDSEETEQSIDSEETGKSLTETTTKIKKTSAEKQKPAESPVSNDKKETDKFLQELRERETKTTYKSKPEKTTRPALGISNAIYAGEQVTAEDIAATRGETIESRLSGWRDDKIRMVVETFARSYGKLPPAAPDKNAKNPHAAKYQFYWEWRNGAKVLTEIPGEGDLLYIIEKLGAEYDGFKGIQSPYSIRNQVYTEMNTALETPKYTNGNRIGV